MLTIDGIKLYTRQELADMLNVCISTIGNYHRKGTLRYVVIGKRVYTSEEALKDFLNGKIYRTTTALENGKLIIK